MTQTRTIAGLLSFTLALGCQSGSLTTVLGDFEISWDAQQLSISTLSGDHVFASHPDHPAFTAMQADPFIEYGSGSFIFEDTTLAYCGFPELSAREEEGQVILQGAFSRCEADLTVRFSAPRNHWLTFSAETAPQFNRLSLTGKSSPEEHLTGFGAQHSGLNMNGQRLPIWCQEQGHGRGAEPLSSTLGLAPGNPAGDWHTSYTCVPWMVRDQTVGLQVEESERVIFDASEDEHLTVTNWSHTLQGSFITGETLPELIETRTEVTGRMTPLPAWSQEGVILRAHGGESAIRATVEEAKTAGIPVAAVWVEDWCGVRETATGTRMLWNWTVDTALYPQWTELVASLNDEGVRTLIYLNPYIVDPSGRDGIERNLFEEAESSKYLVEYANGETFWMDQGGFEAALIDLTNPSARDWLQQIIQDALSTGVSGWMADFSEGLPLDVRLYEGDAASEHNRWPEHWAALNKSALEEAGKWEDSLVFHRSGNTQSASLARAFWLGDQTVTWDAHDGLASVLPGYLSSGLSGYTMQHADTGGYLSVSALGVQRDKELFQRWVELNAFTALFRMHSTNQPDQNHQWNTDEETKLHLAKMTRVFAALHPYRQTQMQHAEETGMPMIRPVFLEDPDTEFSWSIADQFFLGPDILVVPVVEQGATARAVHLPKGEWVHVPTDDSYAGPAQIEVNAPVGSPPVFVRKDSEVLPSLRAVLLEE